jgi:Replication-relaxation
LECQAEPRSWRQFGTLGGGRFVRPDLFLVIGSGEYELRWFGEIDRSTESLPVITRKCRGVAAVLAKPFDKLLGGAEADPNGATRNEQRPQAVLVGADSPTTSDEVVGWSQVSMVELAGLEPATSSLPARRSPS